MIRRILRPPDMNPEGIEATDWVRKIGSRGKGVVESVTDDHAVVDWLDGSKEVVACVHLQRIRQRGSSLDRRAL